MARRASGRSRAIGPTSALAVCALRVILSACVAASSLELPFDAASALPQSLPAGPRRALLNVAGYCVFASCDGKQWDGPCAESREDCELGCLGTWCPAQPDADGSQLMSQLAATAQQVDSPDVAPATGGPADSWYCGPKACAGTVWGGSCSNSRGSCEIGCLGTWCPPLNLQSKPKAPAPEVIKSSYCGPASCNGKVWGGLCATSQNSCELGCLGTWCPPTDTATTPASAPPKALAGADAGSAADRAASNEEQPEIKPVAWFEAQPWWKDVVAKVEEKGTIKVNLSGYCASTECVSGLKLGGGCAMNKQNCQGSCLGVWCEEEKKPSSVEAKQAGPRVIPEPQPIETPEETPTGEEAGPPGLPYDESFFWWLESAKEPMAAPVALNDGYCVSKHCTEKPWGGDFCSSKKDRCEEKCNGQWCPGQWKDEQKEWFMEEPWWITDAGTNHKEGAVPVSDSNGFCVYRDCKNGVKWEGICSEIRGQCLGPCGGTWCPASPVKFASKRPLTQEPRQMTRTVPEEMPQETPDETPGETQDDGVPWWMNQESAVAGAGAQTGYCVAKADCDLQPWGGTWCSRGPDQCAECSGHWCPGVWTIPVEKEEEEKPWFLKEPWWAVKVKKVVTYDPTKSGHCTFNDCDNGSKWEGYCSELQGECEGRCGGTWCPAPPPLPEAVQAVKQTERDLMNVAAGIIPKRLPVKATVPEETPDETPGETPSDGQLWWYGESFAQPMGGTASVEEFPIQAPEETPSETPEETPAETPDDTPDETPSGDQPMLFGESSSSGSAPLVSMETPEETPEETPDEFITPEETPDETPDEGVTPEETPEETPDETPDEGVTPEETPEETQDETPDEGVTPEETPEETQDETPDEGVTPEETSEDSSTSMVADTGSTAAPSEMPKEMADMTTAPTTAPAASPGAMADVTASPQPMVAQATPAAMGCVTHSLILDLKTKPFNAEGWDALGGTLAVITDLLSSMSNEGSVELEGTEQIDSFRMPSCDLFMSGETSRHSTFKVQTTTTQDMLEFVNELKLADDFADAIKAMDSSLCGVQLVHHSPAYTLESCQDSN